MTTTRAMIAAYLKKNPVATVRAIQAACRISSSSVVQYHLTRMDTPRTKKCPCCDGTGRLRIKQ